jgi:hypothetical protein
VPRTPAAQGRPALRTGAVGTAHSSHAQCVRALHQPVHRNNLYCTSLFGNFDEPVDARDYTDGQLWLMDGNSVTPGHPLLVYRASQGDRGAIATVDGSHLLTALRLIAQDDELLVRVGSHWMGQDGLVHQGTPPVAASAPVTSLDTLPVQRAGRLRRGQAGRADALRYPALLSLLLVLGVVAGSVCRWQMRRATSPRAELDRALEAGEFLPYFQPVVRKATTAGPGSKC